MHWLFELHGQRRFFTRRGEGEGLFFSHIFCFNLCRQKKASFHAVAMATARIIVQEPVNRKRPSGEGAASPALPLLAAGDGADASSGRKFVQGHPSVPSRWDCGNCAIAKCPAGWLSVRRTSRGMSLRGRARRSFAPRLPGDVISAGNTRSLTLLRRQAR